MQVELGSAIPSFVKRAPPTDKYGSRTNAYLSETVKAVRKIASKADEYIIEEELDEGLTKKGYRVATASNVPETDFKIDTKVKDIRRLAEAGAIIMLNVAPSELVIIKKISTAKYQFGRSRQKLV
jgi:hypothetical protein